MAGRAAAVTLLDLNENSLALTARRLRRYGPQAVRANALEPLALGDARFESAAANHLLHCLPGPIEAKAPTLAGNIRANLEPGGVLFGATILGRGVPHSRIGRRLLHLYNRKGIFSNADDDEPGLRLGLESSLGDVEIEVVGAVALFAARARAPSATSSP